ncbi:MAG: hypothetical protein GYB53_01670 [Rhodobacteraceae bacterium]|nr:hypothetical protein [Paracoccaceae bacterium]MBR9820874.1 hypothetical protein [Paracoccaceae bacterium]
MFQGQLPIWKIRRELRRFPVSFASKARAAFGPLNRIGHDLTAHRTVTVSPGDRAATSEPVVLLIYQPRGLLESTFSMLRHLVENGLSVILVANHPLDETMLRDLRPWCHRMIARPNIGYDFGGYRDGILHVLREMPGAERLFMLNDSNWYPIRPDCGLIDAARSAPENIYGIYQTHAATRPEDLHVHSYFYRFDGTLLHSRDFRRYWRKMPLINEKRLVIRYREVGMSKHFMALGYTLGSYHTSDNLAEALMALSDEDMEAEIHFLFDAKFFRTSADVEPGLRDDLLALHRQDRGRLVDYLMKRHLGTLYLAHHPALFLQALGAPVLKKNRDHEFKVMRQAIREGTLGADLLPEVRRELLGWDG